MLLSIVFSSYLTSLFVFAFVINPVVCCFLLLFSALCGGFGVYLVLGFSWYLALFYIIYVGGVYVLYIFVSVQSPNVGVFVGLNSVLFVLMVGCFLFTMFSLSVSISVAESSYFLVSEWDSLGYCYFCAALLFGLFLVSLVGANKSSFHR
uniref:NADH dehydrogenase subunit 6 n=1 Tax=Postharmostomum commutatum TaxID=2336775 RepID=A0A5C1D5U7_9TREM|nr:NADH dehydrogenase subunit 6 [Postharmostomum commutatum]QEL51329.1 NADH dehydrogenase subunit 6 [Postharmostomum commutatum]